MRISSIGCTPLKPKASFGRYGAYNDDESEKYDEIRLLSGEISEKVNQKSAGNKKGLAAITVSAALPALTAYAGGKFTAAKITAEFAPNLGNKAAASLRSLSSSVQKSAKNWSASNSKLKHFTGEAVSFLENGARKLYKAAAYHGLPEGIEGRDTKAFSNLAGAASAAYVLPNVFAIKSENGDAAITRTDVNYITGQKFSNALDTVSLASRAIRTLT